MRLALAATLALSPLAASAGPPAGSAPAPKSDGPAAAPAEPRSADRMNLFGQPGHCQPFEAQIAQANKRLGGTRLDREPPGHAFLAVDRNVSGCHELTFVSEERGGGPRP